MGMAEFAVLAVVTLFVLGPDRLPDAIRWVAAAAKQIKGHVATAKEQLNSPEFDELRRPLEELREPLEQLRAADPRRIVGEALRSAASKPSHDADTRVSTEKA